MVKKYSRATSFRKQAKLANNLLEGLAFSSDEDIGPVPKRAKLCQANEHQDLCVQRQNISSDGLSDHESSATVEDFKCSDVISEPELDSYSESCDYSDNSDDFSDVSDNVRSFEPVINDQADCSEPISVMVCKALKVWYSKYTITLSALGALLVCLKPFIRGLPKDPRTVLSAGGGCDSYGKCEKMGDGEYYNFGLKEQVEKAIYKCPPTSNTVELNFNVDGLPITKSTNIHYWPILFTMQHALNVVPPLIACIFCGHEKPKLTEYFKDFVPDLTDLLTNGLYVGGTQYSFKVRCFVCDAPARSYIKGTKGHNSYNGCDFCEVTGRYENHVMFFLNFNAKLRTDESFVHQTQEKHHRETSPLVSVPGMKMISMFPMDYMHQILIGVVKRFLVGLFIGIAAKKLNPHDIRIIDLLLVKASKMWPSDFSRKPRITDDVKRWKATEFRQFLLYLGPGLLKSRMNKAYYLLFLNIHVAITILCRKDLLYKFSSVAHNALAKAAKMFRNFYGDRYVVYNTHMMIHLTDQAKRFGVLDLFSGFPYESYLSTLKRLTKSMRNPLQSLVSRLRVDADVKNISGMKIKGTIPDGPYQSSLHFKGPKGDFPGKSFKKYHWHNCTLSVRPGDNCVILKNQKVVRIKNFISSPQGDFIVGNVFRRYSDAYTKPCESSLLGINLVWDDGGRCNTYSVSDIEWKAVLVPYKESVEKFIAFPMRQ